MTIAKRKERQKEELRGKILEAAKALFIERGFEDTSIRTIAEKIEYSPTTIYLYFKDKDDIFYALHQEGFLLLNQYLRALQNVPDPFERLKAICKAYIICPQNREFYDLMFISRSPMNALTKDDEKWEEGNRAFRAYSGPPSTECIQRGYLRAWIPKFCHLHAGRWFTEFALW